MTGIAQPGSPRLLTDLLDRAAAAHPERPALDFTGRIWRYGELAGQVDQAAAALQRLGVGAGDRVCLCLANTPHYVIAYFAVLRAGGIVVNMNPLYSARELAHLARDSGARWAFAHDVPGARDHLLALPEIKHVILCPVGVQSSEIATSEGGRCLDFALLLKPAGSPAPVARSPQDIAVLQYTGGTTGLPKGAALTHAGLVANCLQLARHDTGLPPKQETVVAVLPMFHVFALSSVLHFGVYSGALLVLLPRFEVEGFVAAMARTRPHRLYVVPTILIALNELPADRLPPMSALRLCVSGGAPLPSEIRSRFEQRSGARVVEGYGLTEASPTVACNPVDREGRSGSAGVAFPNTIIEIRSIETDAPLAPGQIGEVCVRGPQLMQGYWRRPEETRKVMADGLLRTGDVGYLDGDGYLFLVDRIKDLILCGGYNVYPRVIEEALYEHPDVVEAVVIGVPDAYRGEAPKAFVVLRSDAATRADDLRDFLSTRISRIEMPRDIELRATLPKTTLGKPSRRDLRDKPGNRG